MKSVRILFFIATAFASNLAHADTFTYVCKDHGRSYPLKIDDVKNTLTWKGIVYKITDIEPGDVCAKSGWRAENDGVSFDFCTATQGYADFKQNGVDIQCDQTLMNNKRVLRRK